MKKKKIKFTVRRKNWLRGKGDALLLNENGSMCCLGFLGRACGLKKKDMLELGTPEDVDIEEPDKGTQFPYSIVDKHDYFMGNTGLCYEIIDVNDAPNLSSKEREQKLTKLFAEGGIEVTFK